MRQTGASPKTERGKDANDARDEAEKGKPAPLKPADQEKDNTAGQLTPMMERNRAPGGTAGAVRSDEDDDLQESSSGGKTKKTTPPDRDVTYPIIEDNPAPVSPTGRTDTGVVIHADGRIDRD